MASSHRSRMDCLVSRSRNPQWWHRRITWVWQEGKPPTSAIEAQMRRESRRGKSYRLTRPSMSSRAIEPYKRLSKLSPRLSPKTAYSSLRHLMTCCFDAEKAWVRVP